MSDEPNNLSDKWEKWVDFWAYDELLDEPERNGGGCGSAGESNSAWGFIPETESKCMAINIAGEIWTA